MQRILALQTITLDEQQHDAVMSNVSYQCSWISFVC